LNETVAELEGPSLIVVGDVSDPDDVDRIFSSTVAEFERVDLLFNNAGAGAPPVPIDELTVEQWRAVVDVNLTGSFLCARAAFAQMRTQEPSGGRIINNGSISATTPRPFSAPYTSTKHAITGLTKSLALDGRDIGITCGQIDIGNAVSPMTDRMRDGALQPDGSVRSEPRMAAADVGRAVVYMAGLPPDTNVLTMTVMANGMPFVGRG
jgi:NAD(P)-dependent dehydrogenase (short-subunit alcohol dehydrogenase family)